MFPCSNTWGIVSSNAWCYCCSCHYCCSKNSLTGAIFETGAYGVPSKSQKSFICGWVRQTITLKSPVKGHPPQSPPGRYSDYPYFGCSTKNQVMRPALDFLFFSEISSRNPFTTTWYQWRLVWRWFRSKNR